MQALDLTARAVATTLLCTLALHSGAAALAASTTPRGDANWLTYNQRYDAQRYSPLKQITARNVSRLKPVCSLRLGDDGPFQTGPLVIDGTMFVTTAHTTVALDPTTCAVRWRTVYAPVEKEVWIVNRGLGYLDGRVFRGTPDGRLLAMDASSGAVLWTTRVGDPNKSEYVTAAPIAWQGRVYVGLAGSDWGVRGRVLAFDAATGKELWRFNTIPMGKDVGAESWRAQGTAANGGGGTWSSYTLDETSGELFFAVANPGPDYLPDRRPGDNLFTNSLVVLDAATGALKWWYQVTPNDAHDWDLAAAPVLFRDRSGAERVALGSKDGHVYVVDRSTHQLVFRTAVVRVENTDRRPTPEGVHVCPGGQSGIHWNSPAVDSHASRLFVGSVDGCGIFKSDATNQYQDGEPYNGGSFTSDPAEPPFGWISALDSGNGKILWRYRSAAPIVAGITPTAGGILFSGDLAGNFLALDSQTGKRLLLLDTGGAVAGGVITYAIAGRQFVATTSGNVSRTSFKSTGTPTIMILALDAKPLGIVLAGPPDPDARKTRELGFVDINWGKLLYARYCADCHGASGEGLNAPHLKDLKSRRTIENTIEWLKNPQAPMPALYPSVLSEQDVADLATYVRGL